MLRVKKNDTVVVLAGKDKGSTGEVIELSLKENLVKVKNVNIKTKHMKARRQGQTSKIQKQEGFIDLSNVMPLCPSCSKACRIRIKLSEDGKKARVCSNCNEIV
jgi:large subunit ribosomal protein L24